MLDNKNRVYIFDTTMRDGEQSPGASMSLKKKFKFREFLMNLELILLKLVFQLHHPEILKLLKLLVKY